MAIRQFRPVTPATRFRSVSDFADITKTTPEKALLEPLKRPAGRNNKGHVTTRHQGGGHKRQYRRIEFRRNKFAVPARVAGAGDDPKRPRRPACRHSAHRVSGAIIGPKGLGGGGGGGGRGGGVAMGAGDRPRGGGEGKTSGGRPPTSPWGKVEGKKTRHKKKPSTKLIVRGRKRGKATQ